MLEDCCIVLKYVSVFFFTYYIAFPLIRILYIHFIAANIFCGRRNMRKHGDWAAVTGATDGIGLAYAHELAKDGFNILLISRTESKLKREAMNIESTYKVKTKICAVDFMKTDIYGDIKTVLSNLDIGVLVNNVGMAFNIATYLHDQDLLSDDFMTGIINCNATSGMMMTRLVLPAMVSQEKGGVIINISSIAGRNPIPYYALYSATKVFLDFFTRGIQSEMANHHDIIVQSVMPGYVATKMTEMQPAFFSPSPTAYVRSALKRVGIESRTTGCLAHDLFIFPSLILPDCLTNWFTTHYMKNMMEEDAKNLSKTTST